MHRGIRTVLGSFGPPGHPHAGRGLLSHVRGPVAAAEDGSGTPERRPGSRRRLSQYPAPCGQLNRAPGVKAASMSQRPAEAFWTQTSASSMRMQASGETTHLSKSIRSAAQTPCSPETRAFILAAPRPHPGPSSSATHTHTCKYTLFTPLLKKRKQQKKPTGLQQHNG